MSFMSQSAVSDPAIGRSLIASGSQILDFLQLLDMNYTFINLILSTKTLLKKKSFDELKKFAIISNWK